MTAAERWITRALGDSRTVTFREVAREVGCHVHASKNYLQAYLATHPDVTATYLLTGPLRSDSTVARTAVESDEPATGTQSLAHMSATQKLRIVDMDQVSDDERNSEADAAEERDEIELEQSGDAVKVEEEGGGVAETEEVAKWGVVLAAADVLDEKKKMFVDASVHVYALSPAPVKDPAQFVTCAINVREHASAHNPELYGTITGEPLVAGSKPLRDGGMDFSKKAATAKGGEVKKETAKTGTRKEEPKAASKMEPKVEPKTETKDKAATRKPSNKRRIVVSDDEDDAPSPSSTSAPPSKPSTATATAADKKASGSKLEPTSSMVRADDQAAMEAMMGMDIDFDDDDDTTTGAKPAASVPKSNSTSASASASGGKRRTRRVKKSKVEMDEKGYMVTKDYYTDETCSGSDTDTDAKAPKGKDKPASSKQTKAKTTSTASTTTKPKAPAPAVPASGGSGGGGGARAKKGPSKPAAMGQSTLAGFFKKK